MDALEAELVVAAIDATYFLLIDLLNADSARETLLFFLKPAAG